MTSEFVEQPSQVAHRSSWGPTTVPGDIQTRITQELSDPAWDTFLEETGGGSYAQSSLWAQTKAFHGWRAMRVTAVGQGRILGGAQALLRTLPVIGGIGYVPGGPVGVPEAEHAQEAIMRALLAGAKQKRCHALIVQPMRNSTWLDAQLPAWGLRPTSRKVIPEYTLLLDLTPDTKELLAQMKPKTRYNTRIGERKGLTIREGEEEDYGEFYRLLEMTGQRQRFKIAPEEYYTLLRQTFLPRGNLKLFVAEYEGKIVSAQLAIPFGDTVVNKMTVWSGEQGHLKPNEALLWRAIRWAKEEQYRYYDFGGMSSTGAKALLRGEPLPEKLSNSVTSFKLGFGGQVAAFSKPYVYFSHPIVRWADSKGLDSLEDLRSVKKVMHFLRTR